MDSKSLAIITVATNRYIEYWAAMTISADVVLRKSESEIVAHVLTDQVEKAEEIAKSLTKIKIIAHKIPSYGWPEASLYRYRLIHAIAVDVSAEIVMHLDADMLVIDDFLAALPDNFKNGIALVCHPGYYRPSGMEKIFFYLQNKNYIRQDLAKCWSLGGLGDWETSKYSISFVPRKKRDKYVCGGSWFGIRQSFFKMVEELALLEKADTDKGVLPKWHDESILNSWASFHETTVLSPSFCFDPKYPQLSNMDEFIRAIDKND